VGVDRPGAWAEFVAIPQENGWHADASIPLDVLSCFDPLGNAVHTALSFDLVGEDVLITGAVQLVARRFRFANAPARGTSL
jgi:threonine 3-dehydrogenase